MDKYEIFAQLHKEQSPFILGNTWDVKSAKSFEATGFKAIGTSSHALANAWGYDDGEHIPFGIIVQLAKRIGQVTTIPLTVDLEAGFGNTPGQIIENIKQLIDAGVAGINIEDTIPNPVRTFQEATVFAKTLFAIANYVAKNGTGLFINVRTDGFLLGHPTALAETLERIPLYEANGADGIFVPCITNDNDIREVVQRTTLPVNVMCMPGLPSFAALQSLGVKRISMGPFLFNKMYSAMEATAKNINESRDTSLLF